MKRNATEALIRWKEKDGRKPLIIQGARQVGKTWLMKEFAKTYYKKVAYISFNDQEDAKQIFSGSYNIKNIILSLGLISGVQISADDTLIILDEIQECERALNALKFFNENAPQYHIMAAGSLLGVAVRQKNMSFPVGQVEFLNLYPLTFSEFLDAVGEKQLSDLIFEGNDSVIKVAKEKYITLLKQYLFVGGMPEAVRSFDKNKILMMFGIYKFKFWKDIVRIFQNILKHVPLPVSHLFGIASPHNWQKRIRNFLIRSSQKEPERGNMKWLWNGWFYADWFIEFKE